MTRGDEFDPLVIVECEYVPCRRKAAYVAGGGAVGMSFACKLHGPDATAAMVADGTIRAEDAWEWEAIQ